MRNSEKGLVDQYVTTICQLAVRADAGEDVRTEVATAVRQAQDHFLAVVGSDPATTLESFIGQLRFRAELVHQSQPQYAATLSKAAEIAGQASTD